MIHTIESVHRPKQVVRLHPVILIAASVIAVLLEATLPPALPAASVVELPLLVVVYFSMVRQNGAFGAVFGAAVGLLQDALSHGYIGQMGMANSIVGYLAATAGLKLEHDSAVVRALLIGLMVCIQEGFLYVLMNGLLGLPYTIIPLHLLISTIVNMALGLILFPALDRFRRAS